MKLQKVKQVREEEVAQYEMEANRFGLFRTSQGREFTANGKIFTLDGVRSRGKRFPVVATDESGVAYKFSAEYVVEQFKAQQKAKKAEK